MAVTYASLQTRSHHIRGLLRMGRFHDFQEGLFPRTFDRRHLISPRLHFHEEVDQEVFGVALASPRIQFWRQLQTPAKDRNGRISTNFRGIIPSDGYSSMGERLLTAELPCVPLIRIFERFDHIVLFGVVLSLAYCGEKFLAIGKGSGTMLGSRPVQLR